MTRPIRNHLLDLVCLLLFFAAPVFALNPTADQWLPLPKFSGGINIMADRAQLPEGQLLTASNFIWRNDQLEGREGFYRFADPVSANGVKFIDVFSNSQGANYLMYSDGVGLWYRASLTGFSNELNFGRSSAGTVDTYNSILQVRGNTIASQKWRTIFGTGEGLIITVDGVERTIDKIILDTLIFITANPGNETAVAHNIDYSAIAINDALTVSDNYWIFSTAGKFYFNRPDSFVTVDSLVGVRFPYSGIKRLSSTTGSGMGMQFTTSGTLATANYAGQYARVVTNPVSTGMPKNPVVAGHHFYMSYPIYTSGSALVKTYGMAFPPDTASPQYIAVEALTYDSTTKFTRTVDSVRIDTTDLHDASGNQARYLRVYCDTCFFDADTNSFITGDWFFAPNYSWTYSFGTYNGSSFLFNIFPVVGGYRAADGAWLVACPPDFNDSPDWDIDSNNCSVIFYRMKKNVTGQRGVGGYNLAVLHKDRVFEVRSAEPDRIYWSEPFQPDSFFGGSVTIIDQQHPITVAAEQFGELVVYTTTGRWKMFPDATGTLFGKQKMDGSRGCVSRGSFLNIDEVHYGLSADGYWQSAGNAPEIISDAVASYFTDSINVAAYSAVRSGYDADNDNIWVSFPTGSAVKNTCTLVYHRATKSWWRQSFVAATYAYNGEAAISDSVRFIAGGKDSSTIYVRGHRKDDGAAITATLQTPYLDFQEPQIGKRFKSFMIGYDAEAASAVSVLGYRDFSPTAFDTTTFTTDAVWKQKWLRVKDARYRGNNLSLGFSITDAGQLRIPRISVQMIPLGEEE